MGIYIATLTTLIVQTYFDKLHCVCNIGDLNIFNNSTDIIQTKITLKYAIKSKIFEQFNCLAFVISSDTPDEDVEIIEDILYWNEEFRYKTRYYLLILNGIQSTFNATSFFQREIFDSIVNVLLLVEEEDGCVYFYTHMYSGMSPLEARLIGKLCESYDISLFNLYPNKQDDLMGKELRVSTFNFRPYIYLGSFFVLVV